MFTKFLNFFRSEDDKDPAFIQLTRTIVVFVILVNIALLLLVTGIVGGENAKNTVAFIALSITLILELISLFLAHRNQLTLTKLIVPLGLILAVAIIASDRNGLKNTALLGLPVILVISAILLGRLSIYFTTPIAILCVIFIAYTDLVVGVEITPAGLDDAIIITVLLIGAAFIINMLIVRLNENIE